MKKRMKVVLLDDTHFLEVEVVMQIKDGVMWNKRNIKFPITKISFNADRISIGGVVTELPKKIPVAAGIPTKIGASQLKIRLASGI